MNWTLSAWITKWFRSEVLQSKDYNPKWATAPLLVGLRMTQVYVGFNKPGSQGETLFIQFGSQVESSWETLVSLVHAANPNHSVTQCAGIN